MTQDLQRLAAKRLSLLPTRQAGSGPRNGAHVGSTAQLTGDLFWRCGVECFKPVYTRIDARHPARFRDSHERENHAASMDECKKILQEHRNLIFECVLPLFAVRPRRKDEPISEADGHAQDYFCKNVFPVMIDMLVANLPAFVNAEDNEQVEQVVRNIAEVQKERLSAQLLNFKFEFRPVAAPGKKR